MWIVRDVAVLLVLFVLREQVFFEPLEEVALLFGERVEVLELVRADEIILDQVDALVRQPWIIAAPLEILHRHL